VQGKSDIISNVCQNRFFSNDKSGINLIADLSHYLVVYLSKYFLKLKFWENFYGFSEIEIRGEKM